jgi:hypothetical protein
MTVMDDAVIGNAFHRLDRDLVAARIAGWLEPGGHLALCWSSSPWAGQFAVGHRWGLPELAGYIRSTSFLPAAVLGGQGAAFDAGLAAALAPFGDRGTFTETVSFACGLARKRKERGPLHV